MCCQTLVTMMHHLYTHLLQKRRASKPEKLAKKERPRTTMLHLKPDATPNKRWPVRRRSTVSSPSNPSDRKLSPPAQGADTSSASCPMSLWSESLEQYLQVPSQRGISSGASSWASKCQQSPLPSPCKDNHPSVHHGHGNCHEARPPPGQLHQPSLETEEEIHNLKLELQ